jgi:beta-lactamase regulating signal transducer with metallopeptidase domain
MLSTLARASLEGGVLVVFIWLVGRVFPRLSPGARTILWWCAAAKFVVALVWVTPVQLSVLPAADGAISGTSLLTPIAAVSPLTSGTLPSMDDGRPAGVPHESPSLARSRGLVGNGLLAGWIIGIAAASGLGLRRWRATRGAVRLASSAPGSIQGMAAEIAARLDLQRVPDVRMSDQVGTPLVAGLVRPVVLLPAGCFDALPERQQRLALCHELAHLKRADLWLGCVPALAERMFFFHPLARLAAREYAFWRESACDFAVLEALDSAPQEYGRLLLDLGVSQPPAGLAAAGASWSFSNLKRRLVMLRDPSTRSIGSRALAAAVVALAAIVLVGVQLAARPQAPVGPAENTPLSAGIDSESLPQKQRQDLNYVMFLDDHHTSMSGSLSDVDRARRFRRPNEQLLWFRHRGREFVVRDPALLAQVVDLWKPVNVIGEQQGRLGEQQGVLGEQQGKLGERQGKLGAEQGELGERQGRLGDRQAQLDEREERRARSAAESEALENERRQIAAEMRQLDDLMRVLDLKMLELDKPMRELDDEMRVLDREMEDLDREMRQEVEKAEREMLAILERAISTGKAEEVK